VLATGVAPLRTALLALWIIPMPSLLADVMGGIDLARNLFAAAAELLTRVGLDLQVVRRLVVSGDPELRFSPTSARLPLFVLLSGLGWYRALRLDLRPLATLRSVLLHLLCGVPIQLAAIALELVAFALGAGTASGFLLEPIPWLVSAAAVIVLAERGGGGATRRFVLLDRDGTLVRDHGYTHRIEDYERLPGVIEGLQRLQAAGYAFAIITNQSGIGRGYYGEADFERFQAHLTDDLRQKGVVIEASFHCPHAPEAACACRKPKPGPIEHASRALGIDLSQSWMIGDTSRDVGAAVAAGCAGALLVLTGEGESASAKVDASVLRARTLDEAASVILGQSQAPLAHETARD